MWERCDAQTFVDRRRPWSRHPLLLLTGCTSDPLADQFREGSGKNYIAGDGTITESTPPPTAASRSSSRARPSRARASIRRMPRGKVQVVNFWYAGCAPCRVEAPILQEVYEGVDGDDVSFVGVNVRDQAGTAAPFEETYGITYPSILDVESGAVQLAFAGPVPPAAVPTTIVLDKRAGSPRACSASSKRPRSSTRSSPTCSPSRRSEHGRRRDRAERAAARGDADRARRGARVVPVAVRAAARARVPRLPRRVHGCLGRRRRRAAQPPATAARRAAVHRRVHARVRDLQPRRGRRRGLARCSTPT